MYDNYCVSHNVTCHYLQITGVFVQILFLGQAFTIMLVYVWARRNPLVRMNFFGLFNFQAPYLPWVLLGFSLLLGNSIAVDVLGTLHPSCDFRFGVFISSFFSFFRNRDRSYLLLPGGRFSKTTWRLSHPQDSVDSVSFVTCQLSVHGRS